MLTPHEVLLQSKNWPQELWREERKCWIQDIIPFPPMFNPFPKDKNLDSSKFKVFADDNIEIDENSRRLSRSVENTVGKGEIARYEQFLLFPVFSKELYCRHIKTMACLGKG